MLSRFRLVLFCLVVSVRYEQDMCKMYAWCKVICKPRHVRKGEASLKAISTDRSNPSLEGQLGATHDRRLLLRDEMSVADLGGGRIEQPCMSKNSFIFIYLYQLFAVSILYHSYMACSWAEFGYEWPVSAADGLFGGRLEGKKEREPEEWIEGKRNFKETLLV